VLGVRSIYESKWNKLGLADIALPSGRHFEHHTVTMPAGPRWLWSSAMTARGSQLATRFVPDLWNYELPGGLIEDDEAPETAVAREILEETGFKAREIWHLATVEPMIGLVSGPHHVLRGQGVERIDDPTDSTKASTNGTPAGDSDTDRRGQDTELRDPCGLLHYLAFGAGKDRE
jgi:hypothetical protein